jgi:hypothetical protein
VELMVAGTVMAIVMSFFLSSLTIQKRNYTINDQIVEIQQGARIIGDVIERDLRHAGFMAPIGAGMCVVDNVLAPDILVVSDEASVDPSAENRGDLAARITSGATNVGIGNQTLQVDDQIVEIVNPSPAYDSDANGVNDSDFRVGGGAIIMDAANPDRGVMCGRVTDLSVADQIDVSIFSNPLAAAMLNPAELVVVPARVYQIDAQNRLLRDGVVISTDVEDLQVAVFIDLDEDGDIDPLEYRGAAGNPVLLPEATDFSLAREARASFVLRTRDPDVNFTQGMFQTLENRAPVVGNDGFRRRVWVSTIMLRNMSPRPS